MRILIIVSTALLISLGSWQIKRKTEKESFIHNMEMNLNNASLEFKKEDYKFYSKVKINGSFINKNMFLYGKRSAHPDKNGYYLLSTIYMLSGDKYIVMRGWIPYSLKEKNSDNDNQIAEIEAIIMPIEKRSIFIPVNDYKNNIWFSIGREDSLGSDFYLMQIKGNLPENVTAINVKNVIQIPNNHLEYAITWYALAIMLIFICISSYIRANY